MNFEIYRDLKQRSDEWFDRKLAKLGCSSGKDIIDVRKKGLLKSKSTVMTAVYSVLREYTTGTRKEIRTNDAMQWGIDKEEEVICEIEDFNTFQCGGVSNPKFKYVWLSPDLLQGLEIVEKGYEIKCPNTETYLEYIDNGQAIPSAHIVQVLSYFAFIDTLKEMDLVIYDPRVAGEKYHTINVKRVDYFLFIYNLTNSYIKFGELVDEKIKDLNVVKFIKKD